MCMNFDVFTLSRPGKCLSFGHKVYLNIITKNTYRLPYHSSKYLHTPVSLIKIIKFSHN